MAAYGDLVEQDPSFTTAIYGWTDVNKYVDWSTYIEFCHGWANPEFTGTQAQYTAYLQYWDGSRWTNVDSHVGYFSYSVCFRWSLSGKKAGSYRIRTIYYFNGSNHINRTPAFIVER